MIPFKVIPTSKTVVEINKFLCQEGGNPHHCYDIGKVESAIHTAFYPGSYPFAAGGSAQIAGALCFYLVKGHAFMDGNKRTGALVAMTFLENVGWSLQYPFNEETGEDALADIIDRTASGIISKEELMKWFDTHKIRIEE